MPHGQSTPRSAILRTAQISKLALMACRSCAADAADLSLRNTLCVSCLYDLGARLLVSNQARENHRNIMEVNPASMHLSHPYEIVVKVKSNLNSDVLSSTRRRTISAPGEVISLLAAPLRTEWWQETGALLLHQGIARSTQGCSRWMRRCHSVFGTLGAWLLRHKHAKPPFNGKLILW